MTDSAIKKRQARAKIKAIEHYSKTYRIIVSDDRPFTFIATRLTDIRFVRVVVDCITPDDIKSVQGYESPTACAREIFCQKETGFEIREVRE
jgi:hypothetical protein